MQYQKSGTELFLVDGSSYLYKYTLSTAYRIETASFVSRTSYTMGGTTEGFALEKDGSRFYAVGNHARLYGYSIGSGVNVPSGYHAAHTSASTDSTYWNDINSMTASESAGDGNVYYCVSTDDRTTWKIAKGTDGERSIVRNNSGTWQYNSNGTYGSETWANAAVNAELYAIQEAMEGASETVGTDDVTTASLVHSLSVSSQTSGPEAVTFNAAGTRMIVGSTSDSSIKEYHLSTGFDLSTASYD